MPTPDAPLTGPAVPLTAKAAAAAAAPDGLEGRARIVATLAVALSVLLSTLDYALANVALPAIARDIHTQTSDAIWVINAYQLANVLALLPLAALGDRWGFARVCRIGLAVFVLASLFCAMSHTLPELALARGLQGLGASCIMSVNAGLIRFIYPQRLLGRGIALNGLVVGLGVAIGPTIASGVLSVADWPWLFLINLPLGGLALLFAAFGLPQTPRTRKPFDGRSALLNTFAFGGLIVGGDRIAHEGNLAYTVVLLAIGALCLVALVRRQLGRSDPMLPVDLLAIADFRLAFIVGFLGFVGSNFFMISIPFTLQGEFQRSPVATGLLMTPWPLAIVLVAPLIGRLSDRYPAGLLSSIGLGVNALGFVLLRLLPHAPSDLDIAWRIGLAGAGFGWLQPPNNRAMLLAAPRSRSGSASGMISVSRLLGQTVGAMLVAMAFGFLPHQASRTFLTLAATTAALAALLSVSRLRQRDARAGSMKAR